MNLENYLKTKIAERKNKSKKSLLYIPYLTLGDPSLEKSYDYANALIEGGADVLELGIPFSDPIADGQVIQAAMERALNNDNNKIKNNLDNNNKNNLFNFDSVFEICNKLNLNKAKEVPIIFLIYSNTLLNAYNLLTPTSSTSDTKKIVTKSLEKFLANCKKTGVKGLIIPDLPIDTLEAEILSELSTKYDVVQITLITPNMHPERLEFLSKKARGWIYYVSSLGVTGMRSLLPKDIKSNILKIREYTNVPIFAGFGIHKSEQVNLLKGVVDGVIVGSYNQSLIAKQEKDLIQKLISVTKTFRKVCDI